MTAELSPHDEDCEVPRASTWYAALAQLPGYDGPRPDLPRGVISATHRWAAPLSAANARRTGELRPRAIGVPARF
jgi:hypothetical protein